MSAVSFSGFNGIDFGSIIDATINAESSPLNALKQQQTDIKNRDSALSTLSGGISTMETQAAAMISSSLFTTVTANSSNTGVGSASVGSDAISGNYTLHVDKLAKSQVTASTNGYATRDDIVADGGSISFTIDGATTTSIDITAGTSLTNLRNLINAQNSGVVATIVNTGNSNKLVISSRTSGEAHGFTINNTLTNSTGTALAYTAGQSPTTGNSQNAQDAVFTLNGIGFTSDTNTTTDAIPGLALKLSGTGDSEISVAPDYGSIETSVKAFITTYNQLRQFATLQNNVSSTTGTRGPLANDSVLRQTLGDLRDVLLTPNDNGGRYKYLADIGVTVDQTGNLQIDEKAYTDAVNANPGDVQKLMQGSGSLKGVFGRMKDQLQNLDGTAGLIKTTRESVSKTLKNVGEKITAAQLRLDMRKRELQKIFAAADQAISKLNAMTGQLSQLSSAKTF
ncbi:MAG TPA: flagellar filament capping protein FliD [Terriglobia bacterium]|nr:flagellar filament capping protein FliD [Terriglobia bacterium]